MDLEYLRDRTCVVRRRLIGTALAGIGGGALIGTGLYLNGDEVAMGLSGSYEGYSAIKVGSLAASIVGMAAGATALGFLTSVLFVPK